MKLGCFDVYMAAKTAHAVFMMEKKMGMDSGNQTIMSEKHLFLVLEANNI